jgi:nucleoside diphosphate kinase
MEGPLTLIINILKFNDNFLSNNLYNFVFFCRSGFVVDFKPSVLTWKQFRADLIGATDPTKANVGSISHDILAKYQELGIASQPNMVMLPLHISKLSEYRVWETTIGLLSF